VLAAFALLAIATHATPEPGAVDLAAVAQRLGLRPSARLLVADIPVLATTRAFVALTAEDAAPPRSGYEALRELAAWQQRFPPQLLRAFVGVLGGIAALAPRIAAARAA
jgi:hypothetical protein